MKEKKQVVIRNFTTLQAYDGGGRVKVVRNEAGEEAGFEVRGVLTTFDVVNVNGGLFRRDSYDKFVDDYFIKNSMNVPLVLYHNDTDPRTVCGIVRSMAKTDTGVEIVGYVPRSAYYYNLIKSQIEEGILQGFSNYGGVMEMDWDEENEAMEIKEFALLHASLVATPADTGAMLKTVNTAFVGFGANTEQKNVVHEKEEKKEQTEGWRLLV